MWSWSEERLISFHTSSIVLSLGENGEWDEDEDEEEEAESPLLSLLDDHIIGFLKKEKNSEGNVLFFYVEVLVLFCCSNIK